MTFNFALCVILREFRTAFSVASVSSRGSSRKLRQEQKKKNDGGGGGERRNFNLLFVSSLTFVQQLDCRRLNGLRIADSTPWIPDSSYLIPVLAFSVEFEF